MTREDQARVLQMVADGRLSAEEAASLLEALEPERAIEPVAVQQMESTPFREQGIALPPSRRSLVINITEGGDTKVNLRIPLGLAHAATKFIPNKAQEYLDEYHIDIRELLTDMGSALPNGPLIDIQDDEDTVRIAVE